MSQKHQDTKLFLRSFTFVLLCYCGQTLAQQNKIATVELQGVVSAYIDRPGDLYLLQKNNTLKKFDSLGNLLYEKKYTIIPTLFEPRDGARMFMYQKETNLFSFFSQETKQEFSIQQQYAIEPILACASGDHNIWLLDKADLSIKRINPSLTKVLAEATISQKQFIQKVEILSMREYQNFLFIHEKNAGILIFNSLGIQIRKVPVTEITYFNFLGEELYYKKNDKLIFHDLFDASIREMPVDSNCTIVLLTDSRQFLLYKDRLEIFRNH